MKTSHDDSNWLSTEEQRVLASSLEGEYTIIDIIGEGTTGMVFKAKLLSLSRVFAIKVLKFSFAQQHKIVQRFLNEAQVAARLRHPNIVNIIDVKQESQLNYFVMDYIGEQNLESLIESEEKLPVIKALDYAIDICDALAHAHKKNIIHRDIKPSNIVMSASDGRPVLTDFSIAKISQEGSNAGLTVIGAIMGTYWYMSPEQFQGKGSVDNRSDIYSFGALIYEMITGCRPFNGETLPELTHAHLHQIPMAPSELSSGIPQELDLVVLQCLEKAPSRRYQNAAQLKEALIACRKSAEKIKSGGLSDTPQIDHMAAGRKALERNDFIRASMEFGKVPQYDPDYPEAMMLLEQVNTKIKTHQDSEEAFREGKSALDRGQIDLAIKLFSRSLAYDNKNERALRGLKEAKIRRDQRLQIASLINSARKALEDRGHEQVVSACERILEIDPNHSEALFLKDTAQQGFLIEEKKKELFARANELRNSGDLEGALNTIRQIKDLDPASTIAHNLEQEFLKEIERQKRIQENLKMANEQALREDYEAEIESWNILINLAPEKSDQYLERRRKAEEAGKRKKRIDMLLFAASECMEKEFWGKAIKICEEILKLKPDHAQTNSMIGKARKKMEKEQRVQTLITSIEKTIVKREFKDARDQLSQLFRIYPGHTRYSALEKQLRENLLREGRIKDHLATIQRSAENANLKGILEIFDKLEEDIIESDPEYQLLKVMRERSALLSEGFQAFMNAVSSINTGNTDEALKAFHSSIFNPPETPRRDMEPVTVVVQASEALSEKESAFPQPLSTVEVEDEQEDERVELQVGIDPDATLDDPIQPLTLPTPPASLKELTEGLEEDLFEDAEEMPIPKVEPMGETTSEENFEEFTEAFEPEFLPDEALETAPVTPSPDIESTDAIDIVIDEPLTVEQKSKSQSVVGKLLTSKSMTFVLIAVLVTVIIIVLATS